MHAGAVTLRGGVCVHRADELKRLDDMYFTTEELDRLDAAQDPALVTPERQQQIVKEMGEQMADLGKPADVGYRASPASRSHSLT